MSEKLVFHDHSLAINMVNWQKSFLDHSIAILLYTPSKLEGKEQQKGKRLCQILCGGNVFNPTTLVSYDHDLHKT